MASQLRGRVTTVDELVRLGQQLEKDRASQTNYEQRTKKIVMQKEKVEMFTPNDQPLQKDNISHVVYCWRCKGSHAPYSCPNYNQFKKSNSPGQSYPQQSHSQHSRPQQSHPQQQHPQPHHSQRPHQQKHSSNQTYPQPFDSSNPQNHSSVNAVTHSAQSPLCITSHLFV